MARQKKDDTGELLVSIEQFTRTRDSVIMSLTQLQNGLTHVQSGLNELLRAYMQHTASILAGGAEMAESLQLPNDLVAQAHASVEAAAQTAKNTLANAAAPEAGKKKRKRADKKERDPNAPKRPLTAAFLYAQQARPIVRKDLEDSLEPGQKMEPNAVNIEVNKRWSELSEADKEKWKASYRESMEKYKEEYAIYRATKGDAAEALEADLHEEEELSDEAEAGALDSDLSTDSEDNAAADLVTKAPSPPATDAKTPRPTKRQKTQAARVNGTANTPVPIAPAVAAHTPVPFPITNAQRAAQAANIPLPSSGAEAPATSPVKEKKDKKKKEKAAPQAIAPAPAAKEPSPDDTKKGKKSGRTTRNTEAEAESPAVEKEKEKEPKAKKRDRSKRKSEGTAA